VDVFEETGTDPRVCGLCVGRASIFEVQVCDLGKQGISCSLKRSSGEVNAILSRRRTLQYNEPARGAPDDMDSVGERSAVASSKNSSDSAGTDSCKDVSGEPPIMLVVNSRSSIWATSAPELEGATARIEPSTILKKTLVRSLGMTDSKACENDKKA
jgi:hypothetical protein